MPASPDELTLARSYIGTTETDDVFNERFDRLGDLNLAIEESLRAQLAAMTLDQPGQASVGSVSYGNQVNIQTLQKSLAEFMTTKGSKTLAVARLVRPRER